MVKKESLKIIIVAVVISWLFNIFPGRFLIAKISTLPLLNRWKILSPQAPIVITNRETVRVSDGGDVLEAASIIQPKLSSLVEVRGNMTLQQGSAVNVTSDGSFVAASINFSNKAGNYFVVLNDGRLGAVEKKVLDPATSLMFFKVNLDSVPTASLGNSKDLQPGDKAIFVRAALRNFSQIVSVGAVSFVQAEIEGKIIQSDYPRRSFGFEAGKEMAAGEAIINTKGEVVGIWNGSRLISSDVLKMAVDLYLGHKEAVVRPQFGFSYSIISQNNSKLTGQPEGALIKDFAQVSAARQAGLVFGDIITEINGEAVNENSQLEEILEKFKPGDKLNLKVSRRNETIAFVITVGDLK